MTPSRNGRKTEVGPDPTNDAKELIESSAPYRVEVRIRGDADLLFHRWSCEAVEAKAKAAKGSKAKKSDDVESYVYRDDNNQICLPGEYLRQAVIHAAKYKSDPRSPRKSLMDMAKAAIINLTPLAPLGKESWDYEHRCRVTIQRSAVTRTRPAFKSGWEGVFVLMVNLPEYIPSELLQMLLTDAGRLVGVGDFRPTYGRFQVTKFSELQ